ncbi:MAG: hypothetical protein P1V51_19855 [Deltaproteobacteria bacterium]|nr:hypothetical protein [Deltaproteobacteria bacterium]
MKTELKTLAPNHEIDLITKIAERAVKACEVLGVRLVPAATCRTLTLAHLNGCPLRLEELAAASDYDLLHDVTGIHNHLDRETGKLTGCFLPRYAVSQ